jgi:hypothetical protein
MFSVLKMKIETASETVVRIYEASWRHMPKALPYKTPFHQNSVCTVSLVSATFPVRRSPLLTILGQPVSLYINATVFYENK